MKNKVLLIFCMFILGYTLGNLNGSTDTETRLTKAFEEKIAEQKEEFRLLLTEAVEMVSINSCTSGITLLADYQIDNSRIPDCNKIRDHWLKIFSNR